MVTYYFFSWTWFILLSRINIFLIEFNKKNIKFSIIKKILKNSEFNGKLLYKVTKEFSLIFKITLLKTIYWNEKISLSIIKFKQEITDFSSFEQKTKEDGLKAILGIL